MTAGGSIYYAVNDRPVELRRTADGGLDCYVMDFATGNLVVDRTYFRRVTPGVGGDVDSLSDAAFDSLLAMHRADLLHAWAARLCSAPAATVAGLGGALGVPLDPPPLGAARVTFDDRFPAIEFWMARGAPTRSQLDSRFGDGQEVVRVHWQSPHGFLYRVSVTEAPSDVAVIAHFPSDYGAATGATDIRLRLEAPIARQPLHVEPAETAPGSFLCPACRRRNEAATAFCGHCGTFLDW